MNPWKYYGVRTPEFFLLFLNAEEAGLAADASEDAIAVWSWLFWKAYPTNFVIKNATAAALSRILKKRRAAMTEALKELQAMGRVRMLPGRRAQLCIPERPGEFIHFDLSVPWDHNDRELYIRQVKEKMPSVPWDHFYSFMQKMRSDPRDHIVDDHEHANDAKCSEGSLSDKAANDAKCSQTGTFDPDTLLRTSRWEKEPTHHPTPGDARRARSIEWATPGTRPIRKSKPGERGGLSTLGASLGEVKPELRRLVGSGNGLSKRANDPVTLEGDKWPEGVDPDHPYVFRPSK